MEQKLFSPYASYPAGENDKIGGKLESAPVNLSQWLSGARAKSGRQHAHRETCSNTVEIVASYKIYNRENSESVKGWDNRNR